jgi:AraC family transcriptional regulator of adaptative response/methylated-DNA-[protein]-cysteine methyltransferase
MKTHGYPALSEDAQWRAVLARDAAFDGCFYYAVETTGIYCRPSCPARRPKRKNVQFYMIREHAIAAGFRACRRCRPNEPTSQRSGRIAEACRLIETAEAPLRLADLATAVGLSPYHFHRQFTAALGITPKAYAETVRAGRVRDALPRTATTTDAIFEAGFNSTGRFYASAPETLGMSARAFRAGGSDETIRYKTAACTLGQVLVAASERGVCAILLGDAADNLHAALRAQFPAAHLAEADTRFSSVIEAVIALVDMSSASFDLPLDIRGTAFQCRVWKALRDVPSGETVTYTDIARAIGAPRAVRAVAGACAANRLAVAVPCHRVVRRDGSLSGYRWGVERKRALLAKEKKS